MKYLSLKTEKGQMQLQKKQISAINVGCGNQRELLKMFDSL